MQGQFIVPIVLLLFGPLTGFADELSVESRMHWPPLFQRVFGSPKISISHRILDRPTALDYFYPTKRVIIKINGEITDAQINQMIQDFFLNEIWNKYLAKETHLDHEARLNMGEIIPISKALFMSSGRKWLESKATGNEILDCWWKVRAGELLTVSQDYLLGFSTIVWADSDRRSFGHYSFCLRKRGGDLKNDAMFDFRAPWTKDHRPTAKDGLNLDNALKISARRENLYDWLYTQTHFRNVYVQMRFIKIHEEQVKLLQAFKGFQKGGNFRVFRQNCASMGSLFVERLLPLDINLAHDLALADLPLLTSERSVKIFGQGEIAADVTINSRTVTPSNRTELRQAADRSKSHSYRYLLTIPEIN